MDKIIFNILKKLEKNGFKAFVVGGYVRDKLLRIETNDIDICTNALPKDIKTIFKLDKITNEDYGNINIKTKKYNIDITTFREEKNYDKHSPKSITYIDDVKLDLKRRDFTINAILLNKEGEIIDYFNGIDDLNNKIIKCIGNAKDKLTEDPLRILRAIRLSILYNFTLDEEIKNFIIENKYLIEKVSYFRKKEELDKILSCKNKINGLKLIKEFNLYSVLGIEYKNIKYSEDILGMYAQINFNDQYPFTKNEKEIISKVKEILKINKINNYVLYKYGLYICSIAGEVLGVDYKSINKMYRSIPIKTRKDIKISVQSIVKLNNNCYNKINEIYEHLEINILNGIIKNKNKDIVKFLRK